MSNARIILCRHAVTDFTVAGIWDGKGGANPPLNERGLAQADDLAGRVKAFLGGAPARVLSSSLARAQQTAVAVATELGVSPISDPDWDELGFGEWDGRSGDQLRAEQPDAMLRFFSDETFRVPGGESHVELHERVRPSFEKLLEAGGTTVVVSHWGPIMSCLKMVLGLDLMPARRLNLAATSMTSIAMCDDGPHVEFVNDIGPRQPDH